MTYAVEFHGPRHKILCYYNANIPFSFVYFACMMKHLILATYPFYFHKFEKLKMNVIVLIIIYVRLNEESYLIKMK